MQYKTKTHEGFRKLTYYYYKRTDRHTDIHHQNYIPRRYVRGQKFTPLLQ